MTDQNIASSPTTIRQRVTIDGHSTTVRLEPVFWTALKHIAKARGVSMTLLVNILDYLRDPAGPLVREIRCNCVEWYMKKYEEGDGSPSRERALWRPR